MDTTLIVVVVNIISLSIMYAMFQRSKVRDSIQLEHRLTMIEQSLNNLDCQKCARVQK